ncbi:MAG: cytochrome c554 family protein [Spirochaetes bacterium]|nr:cytochrome c554 family protein [Spirochaetota bacterium]
MLTVNRAGSFMFAACALFLSSCSKTPHYELSRFVSPETCGGCHDTIYEQWRGSMHSLSHGDVLYREVALKDLRGLTDPDEIKEAEHCVSCHTPVGFVSGMPRKTSDHMKTIPELARKGVQCDYCHSATGARKMYNAELNIDPGHGEDDPGTKRGPYGDSESDYHKTKYSGFHTRSEICGACHDVRHVVFGTKLETPYEEWKRGPYAARGIECQSCHMYQRPGVPATGSTPRPDNPGKAAAGGPERKHVFTHYFAGGNTLVPAMSGDKTIAEMAEERLKHAATLSIAAMAEGGVVKVTVANTGAGHCIPTGLSHVRQMWLEILVTGRGGRVLLHSGALGRDGRLDPSAVLYNTVFGDKTGKPVMNVAQAREILRDRRIEPLANVVEEYRLSDVKETSVDVEAKLWYRLADQKLVDSVMGRGKISVPAVLMASAKKRVRIR